MHPNLSDIPESTEPRADYAENRSISAARVLLDADRPRGDDRRNGMFVHHLGNRVLQKNDVLVERFDLALQLDPIYKINGNRNMLAAQHVEEGVL